MVTFRSLFLLVLLSLAAVNAPAQKARVDSVVDMQEFIHDWQISKQFTLDVANAMPAEDYGFKPSAEEMTFGEQMLHIADRRAAANYSRATRTHLAHFIVERTQ